MAENIQKTKNLYASFQRLTNFPIDIDCQFETIDALNKYLNSNTTAYALQIVGVLEDESIYLIVPDNENPGALKAVKPGINASELEKITKQLENLEQRIDNIVITGGASEPIPTKKLDELFTNSVDRLTTEYEFEIIPENVLDELFDESLNGTGTIRPSEGEYNPIPKNTLEELFKNSIKIQ